MTIFGTPWADLDLEHVQTYLDQADDEPLLWEAKGTELDKNQVRRQVCAFANSHEGGYLILGASRPTGEKAWTLDGLQFPDEPMTWISTVVTDLERGVRPRPSFDVQAWEAPDGRHVAVVRIEPTSTPPCITNGTVYERLPGATKTVSDPQQLASLFARGDEARRDAQARADRAAVTLMKRALEGPGGALVDGWVAMDVDVMPDELDELPELDDDDQRGTRDTGNTRFAIGVAATGNAPNIAGRLFQRAYANEVWQSLQARPTGMPAGWGRGPDPVTWSQSALTCRHQIQGHVDHVIILRAMWDGSAAAGETISVDDVYVDSLVEHRIEPDWQLADELVKRLGGFGDVYVTVLVTGGRLPRQRDTGYIVMRRGPLPPGVDHEEVASLTRELIRATGTEQAEP